MNNLPKALGEYLSKMSEDFEFNLKLLSERDRELQEKEKRERLLVSEVKKLRERHSECCRPTGNSEVEQLRAANKKLMEENEHAAQERESLILELHEVVDLRGKVDTMCAENANRRQENLDTVTIDMITKYRTRAKIYSARYKESQVEVKHLKEKLHSAFKDLRAVTKAKDDLLILSNRTKSLVQSQVELLPPDTAEACVATDPTPLPSPPPPQPIPQEVTSVSPPRVRQKIKSSDHPRSTFSNILKGRGVRTVSNPRKKTERTTSKKSESNQAVVRKGATSIRNYNYT